MHSSWCVARVALPTLLLAIALTACSSPTPTAPTIPETANIAGVWINPANNYRWTLVQAGTTVTGTGSGIHPLGVPITGTLTGSIAGDTFTFSEEQTWTFDGGVTEVGRLHADEMRVVRESMSGVVYYLPLYPPFRGTSGSVTMVRIAQVP
jgi:hypothetical protein